MEYYQLKAKRAKNLIFGQIEAATRDVVYNVHLAIITDAILIKKANQFSERLTARILLYRAAG